MATNPKYVHVTVVNRGPKRSKAIALATAKDEVSVEPGKPVTTVLTWKQFLELHGQQRAAVRREPGILRMVDFWSQDAAGARSNVAVPR